MPRLMYRICCGDYPSPLRKMLLKWARGTLQRFGHAPPSVVRDFHNGARTRTVLPENASEQSCKKGTNQHEKRCAISIVVDVTILQEKRHFCKTVQ